MVRIFVAVGALIERDANVLRFAVRAVGVALGASDIAMQAGEWITSFAVVKLADVDSLPVDEIVALLAVGAKAPLVLIFVTG